MVRTADFENILWTFFDKSWAILNLLLELSRQFQLWITQWSQDWIFLFKSFSRLEKHARVFKILILNINDSRWRLLLNHFNVIILVVFKKIRPNTDYWRWFSLWRIGYFIYFHWTVWFWSAMVSWVLLLPYDFSLAAMFCLQIFKVLGALLITRSLDDLIMFRWLGAYSLMSNTAVLRSRCIAL